MLRNSGTLSAAIVLPGHGPPGGSELLEGQARFLNELHKAVDAAINSGKKLADVVPAATTTVFGALVPATTSLTLPGSVKNWTGPLLPAQVRDTWEEILEKKPHGDIPHN